MRHEYEAWLVHGTRVQAAFHGTGLVVVMAQLYVFEQTEARWTATALPRRNRNSLTSCGQWRRACATLRVLPLSAPAAAPAVGAGSAVTVKEMQAARRSPLLYEHMSDRQCDMAGYSNKTQPTSSAGDSH